MGKNIEQGKGRKEGGKKLEVGKGKKKVRKRTVCEGAPEKERRGANYSPSTVRVEGLQSASAYKKKKRRQTRRGRSTGKEQKKGLRGKLS